MSDPTTPEPTDATPEVPPVPDAPAAAEAAVAPEAPASAVETAAATPPPTTMPPAYTPAPAAGGSSKTPILSILSIVASGLGILGFAIVFIPVIGGILGLFLPAAGVILGFIGRSEEPFAPRGLWMAGIIAGFVGVGIALLSLVIWIGIFVSAAGSSSFSY